MKFKICLISLFLFMSSAFAEDVKLPEINYPTLPKTGATLADFMPEEWLIEKLVYGDLNNDGEDDIALVLRYVGVNLDNVIVYGDNNDDKFDIKPRILAILFKEKNSYKLAIQIEDLILILDPNYGMDDPLNGAAGGGINIDNNKLIVELTYFGTEMGSYTLTLRDQDQNFKLIGYDSVYLHRATGDTRDESYNFLTGKCSVSKGNISSDDEKKVWGNIPIKPLINIDQITNFSDLGINSCKTSLNNEEN